MVVTLALAAACCFALASVLQQRAAAAAPADRNLRLGLLTYLLGRPLWLAGVLADLAGFLLQVLALHAGSLIVVQVLLVAGLEFALVFEAALSRRWLSRREWLAGGVVSVGLAVFLLVGSPTGGHAQTPNATWAVAGAATALVTLAVVVAARPATGARRAALLALAAGVVLGFSAALIKATVALLDAGVPRVLTSWQLYVLIIAGTGGMLLAQSAFQAGPLAASLPTITVADPVASTVFGVTVLAERVATAPLAVALELAAALAIVGGVLALTRTPPSVTTASGSTG